MKKLLTVLLSLILVFGSFAGCKEEEQVTNNATPSVTISRNNAIMNVGKYLQLSATVVNVNGDVVWSSSDENVVSVDQTGLVSAEDFGTAIITVSVGDKYDSCSISVVGAQYSPVLKLSNDTINVYEDDSFTVTAQVTVGTNPVSAPISWTTSDSGIATVTNGVIHGVAQGTAFITASAVYGSETMSEMVTVNVISADTFFINETAVKLAVTAINGEETSTTLSTTALLANGSADSGYTVTWGSSDSDVATVDSNGLVTAVSNGVARITATYAKGEVTRKAWTDVTVYKAVVNGQFNLGETEVKSDNTLTFSLGTLGYTGNDGEKVALTVDGKTFEGAISGTKAIINTDGLVYGQKTAIFETEDRTYNVTTNILAKLVEFKVSRRFQTGIDQYGQASEQETLEARVDQDINQVLAFYNGYMLNTEHTGILELEADGSTEVVLYYDQTVPITGLDKDASLFVIGAKEAIGSDGVIIEQGVNYNGKTAYKVTDLVRRTYIQIIGVDTPTVLNGGKTKFVFDIALNSNVVMNIFSDEHADGKLFSLHIASEVALHTNLSIKDAASNSLTCVPMTGAWATVTVDLTKGVKYESEGISSIKISLGSEANVPFYITNAHFE